MRQQLMKAFDEIHVLDLHGNIMRKETTLDGGKMKTSLIFSKALLFVFFVKLPRKNLNRKYFMLTCMDYATINTNGSSTSLKFESVDWQNVDNREPFYLFIPQNSNTRDEYQ